MTQSTTLGAAPSVASKTGSSTSPREHCVPPFYPHIAEHHDVSALSGEAGQKFYVVRRGRGVGFFTHPSFCSDDANMQTDNYTDASKRGFARWSDARAHWDDVCEEEHRAGCPPFRLAAGFTMSFAAPPSQLPVPVTPAPVAPTPFIHGVTAPARPPPPASTPPTRQSLVPPFSLSPSPSTPANTAATTPSSSFYGSQTVSGSPSPYPHHTTSGPTHLTPSATAGSSTFASTAAKARTFWVAQGINRIFLGRTDTVRALRMRTGKRSLMVSNNLDDLEECAAPHTVPVGSQGFSSRFWAVPGNSKIFSARDDALEALLELGEVSGACMMVSEDLDELEHFQATSLA
ncbi:hypothetical protein B0H16DRAFT_1448400 [Mycena metata]|uniref:Uncharacterized protein n=1 Tax=Mycena metata TaxID=1033252 RepID=A0AAD7NY22_9AGAR|nr:hypothetical protein B0H16DRAFT_1448400 [Mycena metata]